MLRSALGTTASDDLPSPDATWRASWTVLAELGVAGFCVGEHLGGFGLFVDAAATAAIEMGAALHGGSFAGLTAGARALSAAGAEEASVVAAAVASGERICAWGRLDGTGGRARLVDGAAEADALVLLEPSTGALRMLSDTAHWTIGPAHQFDVSRSSADISIDPSAGLHLPPDPIAVALHGLLLAADTLGGTQRMLDRTVGYARQRHAFGKAIGGFQSVQHRLVDHAVSVRGMRLAVADAADRLGRGEPGATHAVALAELSVSSTATHILHDLLQLTGGIGFTWEYGLHIYERRAHHNARLAGNPRAAVRSLADLEGWTRAG